MLGLSRSASPFTMRKEGLVADRCLPWARYMELRIIWRVLCGGTQRNVTLLRLVVARASVSVVSL